MPRLLTIAGSDSGGGAGIEADLKTFMALGGYGMAALTAVTAQNTQGVRAVHEVPPDMVAAQIDAVLEDLGADAVKTGMLSNAAIIETVATRLESASAGGVPIVVDPVMVASSGDLLLREDAREALIGRMIPLAHVLTPNLPEAEALSGVPIDSDAARREAGRKIHALGARYVVIKGGHGKGAEAVDWLFNGREWRAFSAPRVDTRSTHGTGCTFAAAVAAGLGHGLEVEEAVARAKRYVTGAIRNAQALGSGQGPVHHGWALKSWEI